MGQAEFDLHRSNVELTRTEKANDIEVAKTGDFMLLCMDVQVVLRMIMTDSDIQLDFQKTTNAKKKLRHILKKLIKMCK